MELLLEREYFPEGTNGVLLDSDTIVCNTVELPNLNNIQERSCIPEGRYELRKRYSPKFQWHIELQNVSNRELILIHPANDALLELKGCIAPVTNITGHGKGSDSRPAMKKLKDLVYPALERQEAVYLTITAKSLII